MDLTPFVEGGIAPKLASQLMGWLMDGDQETLDLNAPIDDPAYIAALAAVKDMPREFTLTVGGFQVTFGGCIRAVEVMPGNLYARIGICDLTTQA